MLKWLRASEERYARAFIANPLAMSIRTFDDSRYLAVNDRFLHLLGYWRSEVIGRRLADLQTWVSGPEVDAAHSRLVTEGTPQHVPVTLRTKSGERRPAHASLSLIDIGGRRCVVTVLVDDQPEGG